MSAYGAIQRPRSSESGPLPSTIWSVKSLQNDGNVNVTIHHLTLATAQLYPGLLEYLNLVFAREIEEGMTYPQEGEMGKETFEAYFFAADVFLGIDMESGSKNESIDSPIYSAGILEAKGDRSWKECVAGFYYIKPNYPGRSSHICNGGFLVPPSKRGSGYGHVLAKSYVYYAPQLGYQASVFNLVYVNNLASVKLWENLGFTKAGKIPSAGRLKRRDGDGEEFVDAWVFYKHFAEE